MKGLFYFLGVIALLVYLVPKAQDAVARQREARKAQHQAFCDRWQHAAWTWAGTRNAPQPPSQILWYFQNCS
jgi:hypothetical protein